MRGRKEKKNTKDRKKNIRQWEETKGNRETVSVCVREREREAEREKDKAGRVKHKFVLADKKMGDA